MNPVKIWKEGAEDAFDTAEKLFEAKKYHHSLFFVHLSLEKILKAIYVYKKDQAPPPSHDLSYIANKAGLYLTKPDMENLNQISEFNVSARYEDYKLKLYKMATKEFTSNWFSIGKKFYKKLYSELL